MADAYSVSQINAYIKNMFHTDFVLNRIKVSGEVSNCKYHSSGHIYFTLKDAGGTLACVMFAADRRTLKFTLKEGMQVTASGNVDVYERDGKYQLYARNIVQDGAGQLYERYLALKNELEEMGMFDASYKRPIPCYAQKVGIVTASTGAAIQDIINISSRRNPYVQLYLYPAKVQGEGAAATICKGIQTLDGMGMDVLIVGRGGGSIEDLWAFNEEAVARAVFDCHTPVISAVGHETDYTIVDFVSDMRAPTPSAAAELAVFDINLSMDSLNAAKERMNFLIKRRIDQERNHLAMMTSRLGYLSPERRLQDNRLYVDQLSDRLWRCMERKCLLSRQKLELLTRHLSGLSPLDKISGGFGYLSNQDGIGIKTIKDVKAGDNVMVRLSDGSFEASVRKVHEREKHG